MIKIHLLLTAMFVLITSCATKVWVKNPDVIKGKKVSIISINIYHEKDERPLNNLSQTVSEAFIPYLHEAGFNVISADLKEYVNEEDAYRIGDSLGVDYILVGSGGANFTLGSPFIQELAIKLIDIKTRQVELMGTFSGAGVETVGVARKLGKKIIKRMN